MKIVLIDPVQLIPQHYAVSLELIHTHREQGDTVTYVGCDASAAICDWNLEHAPLGCASCCSMRRAGMKQLPGGPLDRQIFMRDFLRGIPRDEPPRFDNLGALKAYRVDGFDAGMAAASTLICRYRDPYLDVRKYRDEVRRLLMQSVRLYRGSRRYFAAEKPDRVYVFNGRIALCRAVFRAALREGVEVVVHERGANWGKYSLVTNGLPHDIALWVERARALWAEADAGSREEIARAFFEDRRAGKPQTWLSYLGDQDPDRLPEGWSAAHKNIVMYNSSEDEMAAIGDMWKNHVYADQVEGIVRIVNDLAETPNVRVTLRMHPNLQGVDNATTRPLYALEGAHFLRLPPDSPVSTYRLIEAADLVICFGSTVGIEAAYMGKPSLLAGKSFYGPLGSVYTPDTHEEVLELCRNIPPPLDPTGALIYGHYNNAFGVDFKLFSPTGLATGTFGGKELGHSEAIKFIFKHRWPGMGLLARLILKAIRRRSF